MKLPRAFRAVTAVCVLTWFEAAPITPLLSAQTTDDASDGYTSVSYPVTCPLYLRGGFTGFVFGLEFQGHQWTSEWKRDQVIRTDLAYYIPRDVPLGQTWIVSSDGNARWFNPKLEVQCGATDYELWGVWISTDLNYRPIAFFGTVKEQTSCTTMGGGSTGGGGGGVGSTDNPGIPSYDYSSTGYDPYDPYDPTVPDDCTDPTAAGGGSGGGGGLNCHDDYLEVEVSYDGGLTWYPFWEGYGTVCE